MPQKLHKLLFGGALLGSLLIFGVLLSPAAEAAGASCPTAQQLQIFMQALKKAQAQDEYTASVKAELAARKSFLGITLDCADQEVVNLQRQLTLVKTDDGDIMNLAGLFTSRLAETSNYYKSERAALDGVGVKGSQSVAKSIRDWRGGILAPLSSNITNLGLWIKNQDLLKIAEGRFDEVGHTMGVLKLSDNTDLQGIYDDARSQLAAARDAEDSARHILLQAGSPADSLAQIETCLTDLSQMYKDFFTISESVGKILTK